MCWIPGPVPQLEKPTNGRWAPCCVCTATRPGAISGAGWSPLRHPGWRVIAPDQLGMGYSERIDRPRVLAERVDDLGRLTDALGVTGPVVTVAHDWGGIVSLGWAQAHRDQLRGVVLTNTAVHQPAGSKGPILIRLAHVPILNRIACEWTPLFVRTTTSLTWPRLPRAVRDAFAAPYRSATQRLPVSEFVADIPFAAGHPSRGELDRIADGVAGLGVPAVLLWGPRDPVFLEEHLRDLQQRLPQAGVHRFERASHLLPEDAPEYADAVRSFVAGLPDGDQPAGAAIQLPTSRQRTAVENERPTELAELMAREHDTAPRSSRWAAAASAGPNCSEGPGHRRRAGRRRRQTG